MQVVRGPEDRVARVADVPAEAVGRPGGRDELHRPLRAGRADAAHSAERSLDQVHGGEHRPADSEAPLRLLVMVEEPPAGSGGPVFRCAEAGAWKAAQLAASADAGPRMRRDAPGQASEYRFASRG